MNLIVLGPQGSGKDTQAEKLAVHFGLELISMGKFLREVAKMDTPLGKEIYHFQNVTKTMVPSRILREVLHLKLASLPREQGIILEGVPRTMDQAEYIDEVMLEVGREVDAVVYLNIAEEETMRRISRRWICEKCKQIYIMGEDIKDEQEKCQSCGGKIVQRIDDTPEGVRKRLQVFREETIPVVEYYRKKGLLADINGEQQVDKVFEDILKAVSNK